ncbi:DUF3180 domain-containing protein [Prauserella rugosa]|uniref:Uncharacterized protein DUF3180 n=1 Tax=Prauserella rugosa TaxID=43354 RepID=A0A660CC39_9PSEU|nr:DUF3180 domain-containing protein [Prauserella rugosa]KID29490.1 Protein of unknown function (DUF3180) [Prauserella sp. Am3]KMS85531.1 membrane protein [Streptomyces regensis]TWH21150.1 uncharacterized protein DUF3180 [Prauserella rugosa]
MHFTRPRELIVAGLVGLVVVYLLFEVAYAQLPSLPTFAGITLAVLAGIEVVLGFVVRSRIREGRVVTGLGIARAVALAKASSLLGALMVGAWLAGVVFLAPQASRLTAAASDLPAAIVGAACAGVLVAAALWLEHCCRAPDTGDRDE